MSDRRRMGGLLGSKGDILYRNTRNAVLSVSFNSCPFIASSGAIYTNTYAKLNMTPGHVKRICNVFGTCYAHMKTNPFPARLFSRAKSGVYALKRRFNSIANHGHHYN